MTTTEHERTSDPGLEVLGGLADRILGIHGERVVWRRLPSKDAPSSGRRFEFEATDGRPVVRGSDAIAAALGLHEYLKAAVGRRVCWDTVLPISVAVLPDAERTSGTARVATNYYLNFCTFSYTTAYWTWDRWQREIDWMALHGVSMPLAAVGHEAVLARVYGELGLGEQETLEFLGGPGYLPFQFMGCLDGWAGPLPADWLTERELLGAQIISRQLEYGMTPVLPAFTGHVPKSLAGDETTDRSWWGFTTKLLAPHDPRFGAITRRVVELQREMFGTAHLYAADPFIEMVPPSEDESYLADLAAALVAGLRAGDPDAVWVMQAWTFDYLDYWTDDRIAAFLDAVPDDAMLVLDLWGEHAPQWRRFGGFRGKRWVWCALHNFGGRSDVFGNVVQVRDECEAALDAPDPPVGIGLAMEATEQNPVVYELATDLALGPIADVASWARDFAAHRYGIADPRLTSAWGRLLATVYDAPAELLTPSAQRGCVTSRPSVGGAVDHAQLENLVDTPCWYDPVELVAAWRDLLELASDHPGLVAAELGHDLVSVAATAMSRACDRRLADVVTAWRERPEKLAAAGERFLAVLGDLDGLLSLRPELSLTTWEAAAASHARTAEDRRVLLDNARRIVSAWSTVDRASLTDYSARLWSGLVGGLYRERWRVWLDELIAASRDGRPPDEVALGRRVDEITHVFIAGTTPAHDSAGTDGLDGLAGLAGLDGLRHLLDTYASVIAPLPATTPRNPHREELDRP